MEKKGTKRKVVHKTNRMSKKELNSYKKRNFVVEGIILFIVLVLAFLVLVNKTFIHTKYVHKIGGVNVTVNIPRFTYFISDKDGVITLKTLGKTKFVKEFFNEELNDSEIYDLYYCSSEKPYYYNNVNKFFITDVEVKKNVAIKTIKIHYSTEDYNTFCMTVNPEIIEE